MDKFEEKALHTDNVKITCLKSGLSFYKVDKLLKNYTHSEIRGGTFKDKKFIPCDFMQVMDLKHKLRTKEVLFS